MSARELGNPLGNPLGLPRPEGHAKKVRSGAAEFTIAGTYEFVVPDGVTSISAVAIGSGSRGYTGTSSMPSGGGGHGGSLRWIRGIPVTPGESLQVIVGSSTANLGTALSSSINRNGVALLAAARLNAGKNVPDLTDTLVTIYGLAGGGNGGSGGSYDSGISKGGGGGAGGYKGDGGLGQNQSAPAGGGGAGGARSTSVGHGGGGVGIYGIGPSGIGMSGNPGGGGSGGDSGAGANGGKYGAGGGGAASMGTPGDGADGAVRIVWGDLYYPDNAV